MKFHLYRIKRLILKKIRFSELYVYFIYWFKKKRHNTSRVLIFAQGRTGSTLLEELLCSTLHFKTGGEILGGSGTKIRHPYQYISGRAKMHSYENFIFHLKIYHLTRDRGRNRKLDPVVFLNKLQKDGWSIIYLHRKNKLNHFLSNKISELRNEFEKRDNLKEKFQMNISLNNLKEGIEERIKFEQSELNALKNLKFIKIVYEEDLQNSDNHQDTVNKILDYLGLENRQCYTSLVKVNQSSQQDIIQNYTEVVAFMKENGKSEFIE